MSEAQLNPQIVLGTLSEEIGAKAVQLAHARAQIAGLQHELEYVKGENTVFKKELEELRASKPEATSQAAV